MGLLKKYTHRNASATSPTNTQCGPRNHCTFSGSTASCQSALARALIHRTHLLSSHLRPEAHAPRLSHRSRERDHCRRDGLQHVAQRKLQPRDFRAAVPGVEAARRDVAGRPCPTVVTSGKVMSFASRAQRRYGYSLTMRGTQVALQRVHGRPAPCLMHNITPLTAAHSADENEYKCII